MNDFIKYAQREIALLRHASNASEEVPLIIEEFIPEILALAEKFQAAGAHDTVYIRTKLNIVIDALRRLAMIEPLTPLTGEPDEWADTDMPATAVNTRHSGVFRKGDNAYCLTAISWQLVGTAMEFYGKIQTQLGEFDSTQTIQKFPFTPKTFTIPVSRSEANPKIFVIHDELLLRKALKFYANV